MLESLAPELGREGPREGAAYVGGSAPSKGEGGLPLAPCPPLGALLEDDTDSQCIGFQDAEVRGRREDLLREELFTEREVAAAAGSFARVARLEGTRPSLAGCPWAIQVGDRIQAMPGASFLDEGVDIYRPGDEGTVSRVFREECSECVEVTWSRTGRKSGEAAPRQRFRFLQRQVLRLGDLVQTLPGREHLLGVEGSDGEGTVSRLRRSGDDEVVEVTCARTGRVGAVPLSAWMEAFRLVRHQSLQVGDVLQSLPGIDLVEGGAELYRPGDEGVVTCFYREERTGEERMQVTWLRSGRKSDESALWMRWFRLLPRSRASRVHGPGAAAQRPKVVSSCSSGLGQAARSTATVLSL